MISAYQHLLADADAQHISISADAQHPPADPPADPLADPPVAARRGALERRGELAAIVVVVVVAPLLWRL